MQRLKLSVDGINEALAFNLFQDKHFPSFRNQIELPNSYEINSENNGAYSANSRPVPSPGHVKVSLEVHPQHHILLSMSPYSQTVMKTVSLYQFLTGLDHKKTGPHDLLRAPFSPVCKFGE